MTQVIILFDDLINVKNDCQNRYNYYTVYRKIFRENVYNTHVFVIFQGCLVQTGKYAIGDEHAVEGQHPDYIFPSIVDVVRNLILT